MSWAVVCGWTAGSGIMFPSGVMGSVIGVWIICASRRQKMGVVVLTGKGSQSISEVLGHGYQYVKMYFISLFTINIIP